MKKKRKEIPKLRQDSYLIDTHCHLDMQPYEKDLNEVLQRAKRFNIHTILAIGIDKKSSQKAVQLACQHEMVFATVGVHPHDVDNISNSTLDFIADLALNNPSKVVGYGEIGLDYMKNYSSPDNQRNHFQLQLILAKELNLPIIIHDRDAHEDTLAILKRHSPFEDGGVMHCFSGNLELAKQIIDLGLHISIPGIVTFNKSYELQNVATKIPLSTMLLETDGPFLAPEPWRGKRNEPCYILYTAEKIAHLRNIDINHLATQTSKNAQSLFGLNP